MPQREGKSANGESARGATVFDLILAILTNKVWLSVASAVIAVLVIVSWTQTAPGAMVKVLGIEVFPKAENAQTGVKRVDPPVPEDDKVNTPELEQKPLAVDSDRSHMVTPLFGLAEAKGNETTYHADRTSMGAELVSRIKEECAPNSLDDIRAEENRVFEHVVHVPNASPDWQVFCRFGGYGNLKDFYFMTLPAPTCDADWKRPAEENSKYLNCSPATHWRLYVVEGVAPEPGHYIDYTELMRNHRYGLLKLDGLK